ncbi:MAG: hypothetical protein JSS12_00170 [Verrucomicrobia bacterium]|nr:hypothetical protein [Verrucomicrobiota bacterium]
MLSFVTSQSIQRRLKVDLDTILGFSFSQFAKQYVTDQNALKTEIMYGLYYGGFYLKQGEFAVVQLMAEFEPIGHILHDWTSEKIVRFIAYLFKYPREGTFKALSQFDGRYQRLISGLRRYFYDVELCTPIDNLEQLLEEDAAAKTKELYYEFTSLMQILGPAVDRLYGGILELVERFEDPATKQAVIQKWEIAKKGFEPFFSHNYSYEDFLAFTRLFGLYGYPPIFRNTPTETSSLLEKVKNVKKIVTGLESLSRTLTTLVPQDLESILSFMTTIVSHLHATTKDPSRYCEGLKQFTCTIATCNKLLEHEAALPSLVAAYKVAGDATPAIVVFDQSSEEIFEKNSAFIATLQYPVIHLSKAETIKRAKELGAEKLIITTPEGDFGFGGARNCQFLLTPHSSQKLLLVDDDMYIHETNMLSCALAEGTLSAEGIQLGRASKFNLFYWDLPEVLYAPDSTNTFPVWIDRFTSTGYSEQLMLPKICLNLPQGNEESHFLSFAKEHTFIKPSFHLASSRYPKGEVPTKHFVGLDRYLKKSIPYVLLLCLTEFFISPKSRFVPTILPWNEIELNPHADLNFIYRSLDIVKGRFWNNMRGFFSEKRPEFAQFLAIIERIRNLDVDKVLAQYTLELTQEERASLIKLGSVYKDVKNDVEQFWQLGSRLCAEPDFAFTVPDASLPLTQGLCLMVNALARGGFKEALAALLKA